jgi:hypothetical protein
MDEAMKKPDETKQVDLVATFLIGPVLTEYGVGFSS